MNTELFERYSTLKAEYQSELGLLARKSRFTAIARGLLFLVLIFAIYIVWDAGAWYLASITGIFLVSFLFFVQRSVAIKLKIKLLKELVAINQNELSGLNGDHSVFVPGDEFVDYSHPYSYDLDIFGESSVYQLLNRSCTTGGAELLAKSLKGEKSSDTELVNRQEAIKELAGLLDWRQYFQATGNVVLDVSQDETSNNSWLQNNNRKNNNESKFHDEMLFWIKMPFHFLNKFILRFILWLLPGISLILFTLMLLGLVPVLDFIFYGLIQLVITGWNLKKINQMHNQIGRKTMVLKKYGSLLFLIEKQNFNSTFFKRLKNISGIDNNTASKQLKKLQSLTNALDNRLNVLFAILANAYLLWDLQVVFRIEKWRKQNAQLLSGWFNTIYEFDSLSGLASFSFNNPEYCFPSFKNGEFFLEMKQGGHPLINRTERIDNDLKIEGLGQFLVITGANMAGKSTFLRTIGVNIILAMAGSVVCAKEFTVRPIALHTSIRTSDSIQKSESYFFAELKRLKSIIDRMQGGEQLFVIIDEMLRGTNSKDKHHGSEALIEQLIRLNGSGLLATHDVALGGLAEKYPENVKNYRFEVEIKDNELVFDYKLKTGISQNLNATFLMKKMGITL